MQYLERYLGISTPEEDVRHLSTCMRSTPFRPLNIQQEGKRKKEEKKGREHQANECPGLSITIIIITAFCKTKKAAGWSKSTDRGRVGGMTLVRVHDLADRDEPRLNGRLDFSLPGQRLFGLHVSIR